MFSAEILDTLSEALDDHENEFEGKVAAFDDYSVEEVETKRREIAEARKVLAESSAGLSLFFVAFDDYDNLDLFVWADDRKQAVKLWAGHYEWDEPTDGLRVFHVPTDLPAEPRALAWHDEVKETEQ